MINQVYFCSKIDHEQESIIGFCLKKDCKQPRQVCVKCAIDHLVRYNCQEDFKDFEEITYNLQGIIDYLQCQQDIIINKFKVLTVNYNKTILNLNNLLKNFQDLLNCIQIYDFKQFKSHINSVIQYQQFFKSNQKECLLLQGIILKNKGKFEQALQCFNNLIQLDQDFRDSHYQKGLLLLKLLNKNEKALTQLVDLNEDVQGQLVDDNEKTRTQAVECFEKAIKKDYLMGDAYVKRIQLLFEFQRYEEVVQCCEELKRFGFYHKDSNILKAKSLIKLDHHREALNFIEQELQMSPIDIELINLKGICLMNLNKYEDALICYNRTIEINPKNAASYFYKGCSLLNLKKIEEAQACFDKSIKINPKYEMPYLKKIQLLDKIQDKIKILKNAIDNEVHNDEVYFRMGDLLHRNEDYDGAIFYYQKISFKQQMIYQVDQLKGMYQFNYLGFALYHQGKFQNAIQYFQKALQNNPNEIKLQMYMGFSLQKNHKHEEAIEYFDKIIEGGFQNYDIYQKKGESLNKTQQYDEAIKCFDEALKLCQDKKTENIIQKLKEKSLKQQKLIQQPVQMDDSTISNQKGALKKIIESEKETKIDN